MKKRIRHLSKSTLSVLLSLCMLVSCLSVGLIATDAAQISAGEKVGARPQYVITGSIDSWGRTKTMTPSNGGYYCYYDLGSNTGSVTYDLAVVESSSSWTRIISRNNTYAHPTDGFWDSGALTNGDSFWFWFDDSGDDNFHVQPKTNQTHVYVVVYYPNTELNQYDYAQVCCYASLPNDVPTYSVKNNFSQSSGTSETFSNVALTASDSNISLTTTYSATMTFAKASQNYKFQIVKELGSSYKSDNKAIKKYFGMKDSTISKAYTEYNLYTENDYCKFASPALDSTIATFTVTDNNWSDNLLVLANTYPTLCTVTFNENGHGTAPSAQTVQSGGKATTPTAPTATGYTFGGWYKESGCTNAWDFSTDTVTSNTTLYAKWTPKEYTITYKDGGGAAFSGTHVSGYPTTHTYGTATALKEASKTGYTFGGWFTNSACTGSAVTSLGATSYTADITLYAKWTINSYDITFSQPEHGSIVVNASNSSPVSVNHGASATVAVIPASGYKIKSLTDNGNAISNAVGSTSAYNFTISNVTEAHTITAVMESAGTCGIELNKTSDSLDIGGTTTFTATTNAYHVSGTITAVSSDTSIATVSKSGDTYTVTAQKQGTATITVSCPEGGSATFTVTVNTPTVSISADNTKLNIGETATLTPTVTHQGTATISYTSSDPSTVSVNGTTVKALKPGTANITATVSGVTSTALTITVATPTLNVVYSPSTVFVGGYTSTVTVSADNANAESTITNKTFSASGEAGTVNSANGTFTSHASKTGDVTVTVTGDVTYNGVTYTDATGTATVTVSKRPDIFLDIYPDGSDQTQGGYMAYNDAATNTVSDSNAMVFRFDKDLSANSIYYIRIWDKANNYYPSSEITADVLLTGTGVSGTLTGNKKLTTTAGGTYHFYYDYNTHKFYIEYPHTVTYHANGHGTAPAAVVAEYGAAITAPTAPTAPTGYQFDGWYKEDTCTNAWNFSSDTVTADTNLYAKWSKIKYTITYPTTTGYTLGGTKPTQAEYGDTISFTVAAASGYRITGVTYTPAGGSATNATAGSNNEYHFSMPDKNVTVSVTVIKTYTVTLTADTGFATKKYKIGSGSLQTYDSAFTVDEGSDVTFEVTYSNGYEFNTKSNNVNASNANKTFTTGAINADTTVTLMAKKQNYTLTGKTSPTTGIGTVKFYSDSACTTETEITTAQIDDVFYAKYSFPSSNADRYVFNSFTKSGTGLSNPTTVSTYVAKYTMGYGNVTITANLTAATPAFTGTWSDKNVIVGQSFTYAPGIYTPSGAAVKYTFNGSENTTGTFTAPAVAGNYDLTITITNQPDAHFTAKTATHNVNIKVSFNEVSVTYYVDMHDNSFSGKPKLSIVQNAGSSAQPKTDADGNPYSKDLDKQGDSTVYSGSMDTPVVSGSDMYIKIEFGSQSKTVTLAAGKLNALVNSQEIWLEAVNEESFTLSVPTMINSTPAVANGYRRIYLAKPYSWQDDETAWENIGVYYWNDNGYEVGWNNGDHMTYLGNDGTGADNYHYYYVDIPKANNGSKINNIIFQGWYTNQTKGEYDKEQTGDIKGIADSANFFVLSKDGSSFVGTRGDDVTLPALTRHAKAINANISEKETINIAPSGVPSGAEIRYTSSDAAVVSVANNGDVSLKGSGAATITVEIRSSLGARITSQVPGDTISFTVSVKINDPGKFEGFSIMSLNSAVYTFSVQDDSGVYPGYFDMDDVVVTVSGLPRYGDSIQSAIITPGNSITYTEDNVEKTATASFTVRYAAQNNDFTYQNTAHYNNINLTATVVSKSIKRTDGKRYGFKQWKLNSADYAGGVKKTTITGGVETVRTTNLSLTKPEGVYVSSGNYVAEFEEYSYVDVTFTFNYEEYVPEVVTVDGKTMTNYFYDAEWAAKAGSHTEKTHTVSNFEVRKTTSSSVTAAQLASAAAQAIEVMPQSNYYNYEISPSYITHSKTGDYTATATVTLQKSPRTYQVYLNGTPFGTPVTYQAYATDSQGRDPYVANASDWYVADSNASVVNAPLVATNTTTYRFRVKGDTYLRTVPSASGAFNRSEVDFSHHEVTHRNNKQNQNVEYLLQNFYIADFFDRNQVIDPSNNLPYDDATFVGGGVVYYSMRDNAPNSKTVDAGYVTSEGVANQDAIKEMLRGHIEANYSSELADAIGTEDAMRVAYGTKIDVTQDEINDRTTGMIYRYLPFENCTVDENNNISTTVNSDTFRYSNSLQAYQYVYASGNENKVTNNGRDMRLYSYYVYSYLTYDQETNVPQTKYEIILSDNYADASTYWAGN